MFIKAINLQGSDNIESEVTLALFALDATLTSMDDYYKFRRKEKDKHAEDVSAIENAVLAHMKQKGIVSCYDGILSYLQEIDVLNNSNIELYKENYINQSLVVDLHDIKASFVKTKEFKKYMGAYLQGSKEVSFTDEQKRVLRDPNHEGMDRLAEYFLRNSGYASFGSNFSTALYKSTLLFSSMLVHRGKDIKDIILPQSNILTSSGDNDDFDLVKSRVLKEVELRDIPEFQDIAYAIYQLNKATFYTTNSGMVYSITTLYKDRERLRLCNQLLDDLEKLGLYSMRYKVSKENNTHNKYTQQTEYGRRVLYNGELIDKEPPSVQTFIKRVNACVGGLEVYESQRPFTMEKVKLVYDLALNQQSKYVTSSSKDKLSIFTIKGAGFDIGSTLQQHASIYMGFAQFDNFRAKLSSMNMSILDVPDRIFYDMDYIRKFSSFKDYIQSFKVVEQIDAEAKIKDVSLNGLPSNVVPNNDLIEGFRLKYFKPEEYKSTQLIPLVDILNRARSYNEASKKGLSYLKSAFGGSYITNNIRDNSKIGNSLMVLSNYQQKFVSTLLAECRNFVAAARARLTPGFVNGLQAIFKNSSGETSLNELGYYNIENTEDNKKVADTLYYQGIILFLAQIHSGYYTKPADWSYIPSPGDATLDENLLSLKKNYGYLFSYEPFRKSFALVQEASEPYKAYGIAGTAIFICRFIYYLAYMALGLTNLMLELLEERKDEDARNSMNRLIGINPVMVNGLDYMHTINAFTKVKDFTGCFLGGSEGYVTKSKPNHANALSLESPIRHQLLSELGLIYPVCQEGSPNYIPDELAVDKIFKCLCDLLPRMFKTDSNVLPGDKISLLDYYIGIINRFSSSNVVSQEPLAPHSKILLQVGTFLQPLKGDKYSAIPKEITETYKGYYMIKGVPVKVRRVGCDVTGYLHTFGYVVYPEQVPEVGGFQEPYDMRKHHLLNIGLIIKDR